MRAETEAAAANDFAAVLSAIEMVVARHRDALDAWETSTGGSLLDDPFGANVDGRYFPRVPVPARVPFREECERVGDRGATVVTRARHLPVAEVLARVAESLGDAHWPLLRRWRQAWEGWVGDVEAFAAETGYDAGGFGTCQDRWLRAQAAMVARAKPDAIAARDTFRIARHVSEAHGTRGDARHALEDASVVIALADAGVPFAVDAFFGTGKGAHVRVPVGRPARVTHRRRDVRRRADAAVSEGVPYWLMPGFLSRCRRRMVEATGYPHLCLALLDMARQGEERAFLKSAMHKHGTWIVDLAGVRDATGVALALARGTGPAFPDVAGAAGPPPHALYNETYDADRHRGRMVVQSTFPFAAEYRFFVVDGRVVAGTASDRAATVPPHPRRGRLDPRVAVLAEPPNDAPQGHYDRGKTGAVEARDVVALMTREARAVAKALAADAVAATFLDRAYTLDVGVDSLDPATAVAEPVEVNTFRNAGLYAVDYARVARALARPGPDRVAVPTPVVGAWRTASAIAGCVPALVAYAANLRSVIGSGLD